ncbi:MarR family transcriptional regulator [Sinomonas humi]|uniref:MarR family transcriptional regulator n=1 Tax=Sinomonas humi TaxID=1338436 RepID=UPI0006896639|nr:MarR family transcriptional regulator [Sinomonas humi]
MIDPSTPHSASLRAPQDEVVDALRDLSVAQDRLDQYAAQLLGLNRTDQRALDMIGSGTDSPAALASALGMSTGATSAVLDRLEAAGYVRRSPDPEHRRRTRVTMTEEAEARCADLFGPIEVATTRQAAARSNAALRDIAAFLTEHTAFIHDYLDQRPGNGVPRTDRSG